MQPNVEEIERLAKEPFLSNGTAGDTDLAAVLQQVHKYLARFVAYPSEHAHVAHTLWIAHTHRMDAWESTPRLAFLSPEPESGKTRGLEVTKPLVPFPIESINTTSAFLFRRIADPVRLPTILYDEIDTIFGPRAKENEDIRAVINAGHGRGAVAGRCVVKGKTVETEELPVYCAVALAGLGNLPDTILSRSIVIKMKKRSPSERVEPWRRKLHAPEGHALCDRLALCMASLPLTNISPKMPPEITDRDADCWEPLIAIADGAGGTWPKRVRVAAVALVADAMRDTGSLGVRLLTDLRTIFAEKPAMSTVEILAALIALDEAPWGDLKGKAIDSRRLGNFLRPYGVTSKNVRVGDGVVKGYTAQDLYDPWQRYLNADKENTFSLSPNTPATSATPATPEGEESIQLFEEED